MIKKVIITIGIIFLAVVGFASFLFYQSYIGIYGKVKFSMTEYKEIRERYPFIKDIYTSVSVIKGKDIRSDTLYVYVILKKIKSLEETIELREDIGAIFRSERFMKSAREMEYIKYDSNKENSNLHIYLRFIYKKDRIYTYETSQREDYKEWILYIDREDLGSSDELENVTKYEYNK